MQIILFEMPYDSFVLKTTSKYIQVLRNKEGELSFFDMTCKHRGGPLTHGLEYNGFIVCPWHGNKTKKCTIPSLDIPYIQSEKKVIIFISELEKIIKIYNNNH